VISDKSPLEREIERRELVKTPKRVIVIVIILSLILGVLGGYAYKLRQELSEMKQNLAVTRESCAQERDTLSEKLSTIEKECRDPVIDQGSETDPADALSGQESSDLN
jgi:hypothetical protein